MSNEEKQTKKKGGKLKWIVIAVIVVIILVAIGSSNKQPKKISAESSNESGNTANADSKDVTFGIGDTADFDGVQVTLTSAILSKGDGQFVTPDDGKYFLELVFDIDNQSSSDISVSSVASFEAYCDDFSLNQDFMGYQAPEVDGIGQLDGSVAAGKKMNGVISYQVPQDFTNFEISYAPSFWGSNKATFSFTSADVDTSAVQ